MARITSYNVCYTKLLRILESRWLSDDKQTLHELADEYGVSAERIRQIEANAIKKLRLAMDAWSHNNFV